MLSKLSNNKGFSLIELMVVVAIIAILSTIAIPSYQIFQAKARQKEGFALMGGYFSAAQASRTEYGFFPGNFVGTGFAPVGTLNYQLVAAENAATLPYGQVEDPACIDLNQACNCGGMCANFKEWTMGPAGMAPGTLGWVAPTSMGAVAANTFTIAIGGVPSTKAAMIDEYTMNQQKVITMISDGLK